MDIGWNFPLNNYGVTSGISDPGIETFNGKQLISLAREIGQNSLDAVLDDTKPVIIEFKKSLVDKECFLGYNYFKNIIDENYDYWSKRNNKKTIKFLEKCKEVLKQDTISVLRISDFNTKGLQGSNEKYSSPWESLVKSVGVSDKNSDAGGSFGIGKSAPFACSYLRTLFYSTKDIDNIHATQGVAKLPSFENEKEEVTQGVGFFGYTEKNKHLQEYRSIDNSFSRADSETGTDVFVIGFLEEVEWAEKIIKSILSDFLIAIYYGKLVVRVNDTEISKNELKKIMDKYSDDKSMTNTINYYKVLTGENTIKYVQDFNGLGEIELLVLFKDNFHRKVLTSRKSGMLIKELKGISSTIQFAGILNLKGIELNNFFKQLENPAHNDWEIDRSDNPKLAEKYKKELSRIVKNKIQELARQNPVDEMDAVGVGEFLPYEVKNINITDDKNKLEVINHNIKNVNIKKVEKNTNFNKLGVGKNIKGENVSEELSNELNGFLNETRNNGSSNVNGIIQGEKTTANENGEKEHFELIEMIKSRLMYGYKEDEYKLIFNTAIDVNDAFLDIRLSGEQTNTTSKIVCAKDINGNELAFKRGRIYVGNIENNKQCIFCFKSNNLKNSSFEVKLYAIKK